MGLGEVKPDAMDKVRLTQICTGYAVEWARVQDPDRPQNGRRVKGGLQSHVSAPELQQGFKMDRLSEYFNTVAGRTKVCMFTTVL